jgi:ferritin-like metal-binding protein YciE
MSRAEHKIVQYLNEAHATETGLARELQAQIAMTPRGSYREALESHLRETREHATRVRRRLRRLGHGENPLEVVIGIAESTVSQLLTLSRTPLALVRGASGEEKVLKNAKDTCATEALEIATYTAIEDLARVVGDDLTAELAVSIRADEQRMLDRVMREIPKLTAAVVGAEIDENPSYALTETGAADAVRDIASVGTRTARKANGQARRKARTARKVPGVARAEGQLKGAVAAEGDLAISGYDSLTAAEVIERLPELSQIELAKVDSYERRNQDRSTILARISSLRADEPWPGYDELGVSEIRSMLGEGDDRRAAQVRSYERAHKNRSGVLQASEREVAGAR